MNRPNLKELRRRASYRCEYCRTPQAYAQRPFQIDHIIAEQHGGRGERENLALSCFSCNVHKGPNIAGIDPLSGRMCRLFNPRKDRWTRHFNWRGARIEGRTAIGRTTIEVLAMNDLLAVAIRERLILAGLYPAVNEKR